MPALMPSLPETLASGADRLARADRILHGLLLANGLGHSAPQGGAVLRHLHPVWQGPAFGVSEFSLSYAAESMPKVRCIAETLLQRRPEEADVAAVRALSADLLGTLSEEHGVGYDTHVFSDLYDIAYAGAPGRESRREMRFALAVEWEQDAAPSVKCYFDLFAAGRAGSADRLAAVLRRLDFQVPWDALPVDAASCRGMAIDLPPAPEDNLRLYLPASDFSVADLATLIGRFAGPDQHAALEHVRRIVLNDAAPDATHAPGLVSLVFARRLGPTRPLIKLDIHMPTLKPDDTAARDAAEALAAALDISPFCYRDSLDILLDGESADCTLCVHDHISIDFVPGRRQKLNLYFRPIGLATAHLDARHAPRRKLALLHRADAAIRAAIAQIEAARATGYADATHRMVFPRVAGFGGALDIQEGRVFQTALIADALLDARDAGFATDHAGLAQDATDLIGMRATDAQGGWRYFPNLPDLPPDADDLAQVMQVLARMRMPRIAEALSAPLDLLRRACVNADGSVRTWIIDRGDEASPGTRRMLAAIAAHWGDTADPEVAANLLYALHLHDAEGYNAAIRRGIDWLAAQQAPDGHWASTWYVGPFYGTFVATRLFAHAQPNHYALGRVVAFLGNELRGFSALDIAFRLLTASLLHERGLMPADGIGHETACLIDAQDAPGAWAAADFIRMDVTRAAAGLAPPRIVTWGSRMITSAVCLKALLHARKQLLLRG